MAAIASVRGRDDLSGAATPGSHDAVDRRGREVGPVGEDDDGTLDVRSERRQPAAK